VEWGIKGQTHVGIVTAVQFNPRLAEPTARSVEHEVTIAFFLLPKEERCDGNCLAVFFLPVTMGTNRQWEVQAFPPSAKNVVSQCSSFEPHLLQ